MKLNYYKCRYCDDEFNTVYARNGHEKKHSKKVNKLSYTCNKCSKEFNSVKALETHKRFSKDADHVFIDDAFVKYKDGTKLEDISIRQVINSYKAEQAELQLRIDAMEDLQKTFKSRL